MRVAIVWLLVEEPALEFVGEATSFSETLRQTSSLRPDVLLIDLHMPDKHEYPPELVKSQILLNTKCVLAVSIWNDDSAKALAKSFGAQTLLDRTKLFSELIPAILQHCPNVSIPGEPIRTSEQKPAPAIEASDD
jgi:DNA-binding NarL/FixJ family response regulator